jgi:hypothetical protein
MFSVLAVILGIAVFGWLSFEAFSFVRGRHTALLQAVRDNPADVVRAQLNQEAPYQLKLRRRVERNQTGLTEAEQKEATIAKALPADPPPRKWVIVTFAFTGLWLVAFTVQYLLDFRIAMAITGNTASAALTSLVVSGLLTATMLAAAVLWEKRAAISARVLRLGLVAFAAMFCAVLSVVIFLAPKRAELDYADRIDVARQSIAMFREDGDTTAASLGEVKLTRLEQQRDQAATFYQATAVVAGVLEGGSSLAVIPGYLLINYYSAQALLRRRRNQLTKAGSKVAGRRERFAARMSRLLERAGVTQDQLAALLAGAGGQGQQGTAPRAPEINRPPAQLPPTGSPLPPTDRPPRAPWHRGPQERPRRNRPANGPDPSFYQA